ncbi:MAG TPA: DUF2283 domain-containing protein [Thermomicrobiaceae bacterium]|nr:DUF2283 domain-containing protein [Thermomicrobiaceae bacterium]
MKITYDPEADALYIELRSNEVADSMDLEPGVTVDLDADGHVIGLEVLDARERLGSEAITSVSLEQLLATPR